MTTNPPTTEERAGDMPDLDDPASVCDHRDERGSTVLQATADRYECIVCGTRFRLMAVNDYDRLRAIEAAAREFYAANEAWESRGYVNLELLRAALKENPDDRR